MDAIRFRSNRIGLPKINYRDMTLTRMVASIVHHCSLSRCFSTNPALDKYLRGCRRRSCSARKINRNLRGITGKETRNIFCFASKAIFYDLSTVNTYLRIVPHCTSIFITRENCSFCSIEMDIPHRTILRVYSFDIFKLFLPIHWYYVIGQVSEYSDKYSN